MTSVLTDAASRGALHHEVEEFVNDQRRYAGRTIRKPMSISPSLSLWLGVPSVGGLPHIAVAESDPGERLAVKEALLMMLRAMGARPFSLHDSTSVLAGLARQGWKDCLAEYDDTHLLAASLIRHLAYSEPGYWLDEVANPRILTLLNVWCRPENPWLALPSTGGLCHALFGEAWCHFALSDLVKGERHEVGAATLRKLHDERPAFMPGLCSERDELFTGQTSAPDLPTDMGWF